MFAATILVVPFFALRVQYSNGEEPPDIQCRDHPCGYNQFCVFGVANVSSETIEGAYLVDDKHTRQCPYSDRGAFCEVHGEVVYCLCNTDHCDNIENHTKEIFDAWRQAQNGRPQVTCTGNNWCFGHVCLFDVLGVAKPDQNMTMLSLGSCPYAVPIEPGCKGFKGEHAVQCVCNTPSCDRNLTDWEDIVMEAWEKANLKPTRQRKKNETRISVVGELVASNTSSSSIFSVLFIVYQYIFLMQ